MAKSVSNVIDQVRLLRCFYPQLSKLSGFVFPKMAQLDEKGEVKKPNQSCVTQVDVEWMDLTFEVEFNVLEKEAVADTVKTAVCGQLSQLWTPGPTNSFLFLSLP